MGENFRKEFGLKGVPTGPANPMEQSPIVPGLGIPQPQAMRPSFAQGFLQDLPTGLAGAFQPGGQGGLLPAFGGSLAALQEQSRYNTGLGLQQQQLSMQRGQQQFQNDIATQQLALQKQAAERSANSEDRLYQQGRFQLIPGPRGQVVIFDREMANKPQNKITMQSPGGASNLPPGVTVVGGQTFKPINPDQEIGNLGSQLGGSLSNEEAVMIRQGAADANDAQDMTPFRTAIQGVISNRAQDRRSLTSGNNAVNSRLDRSYQYTSSQLTATRKPVDERADRIDRLIATLDERSPQADALIAPELLTAMAGGQGSGLRMNEAEIARIIGGRTQWEQLKAKLNKYQLDPSKGLSITDSQRQQVRSLVSKIRERVIAKQSILDAAQEQLIAAPDQVSHRRILADTRKKLSAIDAGKPEDNTQTFTENGKTYNIPANMVDEFKRDHPNAR